MHNDVLFKEENFHDDWASTIDIDSVMVDEYFECVTSPENRFIIKKLEDERGGGGLKGLKILELGAGAGKASVYFAKKGADVITTDISGGMLEVAKQVATKHGVVLKTEQCFSDMLPFMDNSFDVVYAANLLHHVEIEKTLNEARRVLKPHGYFVSWDPLAHNPVINVYRKLASKVRTDDEHPIRMKQLVLFKNIFGNLSCHTTWLFANIIFLKMFLIERIDPNKERYWERIVIEYKRYEKIYRRLERFDNIFLKIFPFMKRYCWNIVVFCQK
jgi:ubiquinone/menaquinone biosynthesis C-methylase UbiE